MRESDTVAIQSMTLDDVTKQHWDVIVVGTGMGGATIGYALAKAGKRVLFCERGKSRARPSALTGRYAEDFFDRPTAPQPKHRSVLANAGREWEEIDARSGTRVKSYVPFVGAGTGGSSALYGMAMERLFPQDFTPRACHPTATDSSLPDAWPIGYGDLVPFYEQAERLYRVRGESDPRRGPEFRPEYLEPPAMTGAARELFDYLRTQGCHPYRLPLACEFRPGCQCCQGYLCPLDCKNDSSRICLLPALDAFGAHLLDECEITRLEASRERVTEVVCRRHSQHVGLRASVVVLAAGALQTPRILLNSASPLWPQGLANGSGLVGRNLMRHYVDLYAIKPKAAREIDSRLKELAFTDFYFSMDRKLGSVQSFGALPAATHLVESLGQDVAQGSSQLVGSLYNLVRPWLRRYLERALSGTLILASIVEDLPYLTNRVDISPVTGRLRIDYRLHPGERVRIRRMRSRMRELLGPFRPLVIRQAENDSRLAHAAGTARFGTDPDTSVLGSDNRAHGLENLYVVDASFFPSSGGTNPSLTIAANALRVAEQMIHVAFS